ncbi:hypothetical protein BDR06DRAFT_1000822 [Suillus hirtellus]|nr:hypothetical protein BDR06DRAFT_1000822 [Suillus hirtellus]
MVSTPVLYHGARVLHEFRLPVMDSQPEFRAQREVQTEAPPVMKQDTRPNAIAESFLRSIRENFMCPICWDILATPVTYCPEGHAVCAYCLLQSSLYQGFDTCLICRTKSSVPGHCPFIYLRQTQDTVVSLMEGIAREFRDISAGDGEPQDQELRSYARGHIWENWKLRSRDSSDRYHRRVDFVHVGRVVSWARGQLGGSARLPSTIGASSQLPIVID